MVMPALPPAHRGRRTSSWVFPDDDSGIWVLGRQLSLLRRLLVSSATAWHRDRTRCRACPESTGRPWSRSARQWRVVSTSPTERTMVGDGWGLGSCFLGFLRARLGLSFDAMISLLGDGAAPTQPQRIVRPSLLNVVTATIVCDDSSATSWVSSFRGLA